jgi:UDP-4-amino-4,6-dideoxy-N-acetyl-beta-L-altrosamine transaminase
MSTSFLPYGRQCIDDDDIAAVIEALRADFLTTGPTAREFEKAICNVTGAAEAVVCSNGTTALHLAMIAAGIGPGDAVIVPSITFLATANAARYCGAEVIFADVDSETGMITEETAKAAIERALTPTLSPVGRGGRVKAILPVSIGGHVYDAPGIAAFAKQHNLKIIADSCHALGGANNGASVGACTYEDLATFSFHPVKAIATGEGGAITTNDPAMAAKMREIRSHGIKRDESKGMWYYEMIDLGYNYRLSDIQCALGLSQIKKLQGMVNRRRDLAKMYGELLKPLAPVVKPPVSSAGSSWHLYAVRIDFSAAKTTRDDVMRTLKNNNIGTQVHYIPVHSQPYYKNRYGDLNLPGAGDYYECTLSLPLFPTMHENDVRRVVESLTKTLGL